jgi:hypothetical protein
LIVRFGSAFLRARETDLNSGLKRFVLTAVAVVAACLMLLALLAAFTGQQHHAVEDLRGWPSGGHPRYYIHRQEKDRA